MPDTPFIHNLNAVNARIQRACHQFQVDPACVSLLAVSKTFSAQHVREAAQAGLRDFGENYVQEGIDKMTALPDLRGQLRWHFIGPLQSNKTKDVAHHFDWIHSIEREKIAQRLSDQRPKESAPLQACVQVNVSGESSKSGALPAEVEALCLFAATLPGLSLRGLMAIPEPTPDMAQQRAQFRALVQLYEKTKATLMREHASAGARFDVLSMGMSADLESAIAETPPRTQLIVRVGTALFGSRS